MIFLLCRWFISARFMRALKKNCLLKPTPMSSHRLRRVSFNLSSPPHFRLDSARLTGPVYATEKTAEVSRHHHRRSCQQLDWQAVAGKDSSLLALRPHVDEPYEPDQHTR